MNLPTQRGFFRIANRLLAVAIILLPISLPAQDSAARQFGAISRLIEKADLTLEDGRWQDAARLYGATIAAYRDFSSNFPEFESELVQFRVSYCRQQLMNLLAQKRERERAEAAKEVPSAGSEAITQAAALCRDGHFAEAKAIIAALDEESRKTPRIALLLATIDLGLGDLGAARSQLQKVLALDANNGIAHYNLVQLMLRDPTPDYAASRKHYLEARRLGIPADSDLEAVLDL